MKIVNVLHDLSILKLGIHTSVILRSAESKETNKFPDETIYNIMANGRGFEITRHGLSDPPPLTFVTFTSFRTPSDVSEEEKDLIAMINPRFDEIDREMIELGSLLSVHWQAGTKEDDLDEAVRLFTKRFEKSG